MSTTQTTDHQKAKYTSPVYAMVWDMAPCSVQGWGGALYVEGRYAEGFQVDTKEEAEACVLAEARKRGVTVDVVHDTTTKK